MLSLEAIGGHPMHSAARRKFVSQTFCVLILCILAGELLFTAHAGIRGPGKYCGVVVFDRWDTCFLFSGPYITYISENVKNGLRTYKGMAVQVDASDVFQPMNPGDGLIRKFEIVGPAPDTHQWVVLDGLELTAESDFGPHSTPTFLVEIRNTGNGPVEIRSSEIGPALLGVTPNTDFSVSDGGSIALITRANLLSPSSWESTVAGVTYFASYTIDPQSRLPERFWLNPKQSAKARIFFKASPGQYEFMFGYGGGVHEEKSLASNAISFDVSEEGIATLVR
jgi:hypothetical protein